MADLQPTLIGDMVLIRPLREDDWPALFFVAAADPAIWALHPASDRFKEAVFRGYFDGAVRSNSAFVFIDRADGSVVGSSRYHGHDPERGEIEIGWTFLVRRCWGGGANREVKRLMLAHAFTFVDTVVFWVGQENWRSQAAMAKIGGVRRPDLMSRPDAGGPHVVFEITKQGFAENPYWRDAP